MQKTLKELSDIEIKAAVYDRLGLIEQAQAEIKQLNQELASRHHDNIQGQVPTDLPKDSTDGTSTDTKE